MKSIDSENVQYMKLIQELLKTPLLAYTMN